MKTSNSTTLQLDRSLSVSQVHVNTEVKKILSGVIRQAIVKVYREYYYRVDFGPGVYPQLHIVSHDLYCVCVLEADCPAVTAVKMYLRDGGEAASPHPPGHFLSVPHVCPICGARAFYYPKLSSCHRGVGWYCEKGRISHYWQYQIAVLQAAFEKKWGKQNVDQVTT